MSFAFHRKIRTGEKHIPWSAVFILTMMWFTWGFNLFAGGSALTFTIRKYSRDPRIITLVMTIAGVIMLGPLISYISDQVWTRAGRRRPFLLVAWLGGFLSMLAFAFLPQIAGVINYVLVVVGLYPVGELAILAVTIACYRKMWDGCATIEPLFLECVPPQQRGRFWAMRGMLFTLAVTIFYQILWPRFDDQMDMFLWLGHPDVLHLTGEQSIYILAAGLFLLTGLFLVFCVEEKRMPQAPNKSFRVLFLGERKLVAANSTTDDPDAVPDSNSEVVPLNHKRVGAKSLGIMERLKQIPIVVFIASFAKDVFLKTENYPYYIVLIIPGIEAGVWGNFNGLMQNDQFRYSKQTQADWAFPLQMLSFLVLTPFAGWYSDVRVKIRWWLRILLLLVSAGSFAAMIWVVKTYSLPDIRETPGFLIVALVTVLTAVSMGTLYVPLVETLLDRVGREHARAWVSLLTVIKSMINVVALYIYIQCSPGQVPPIMAWVVFAVINGTLGTLIDTFVGPMIYDYMPRSQMGTINSGNGIIGGLIGIGVGLLGAQWIVFFTHHIHKPAYVDYDYTSMYLLQFALFIPAILAKLYFINLIVKGKMKKWGAMEVEDPEEAIKEEQAAHIG
ncbi:MAG: hypothetical protein WCI73_01620 [Phycisphaerae bacterium]